MENSIKKEISVVIPCYNSSKTITKAIESCSLLNCNKEIIIVDDASTDNLVEVIKKYDSVKLIKLEKNIGPSAARNLGVKESKFEYIIFLDSDDEFLIGVNELINRIGEADILYGNYLKEHNSSIEICKTQEVTNKIVNKKNPMSIVALFKKQVWQTLNGFCEDKDIHEDWDFWARAFLKKFKFKHIDCVSFKYNLISSGRCITLGKRNHIVKRNTLNNISTFK